MMGGMSMSRGGWSPWLARLLGDLRELRPDSPDERRLWRWAFLLAVAWHILPALPFSSMGFAARRDQPFAPEVRYLPETVESFSTTDREARRIWSPELFSLPSASGFSRPLAKGAENRLPPVATDEIKGVFLDRPGSFASVGSSCRFGGTPDKAWSQRLQPAPDEVSVPLTPGTTGERLSMEGQGMLAGDVFRRQPAPDKPWRMGAEQDWEVSALLSFGADGLPAHVFLEKPLANESLNRSLLRALYRWELAHPGSIREGRVVLRYVNPAPVAGVAPQPGGVAR